MLFTKRKQYEMSLKRRADDVESQNEQLEKKIDALQYNVNKLIERNYQIFAIEKDKLGDPVVIYKIPEEENYHIYLKDSQSKLDEEYDFAAIVTYQEAEKLLRIEELKGTTINQGYGSICIGYLQEVAHSLRVRKIVVTIDEPESQERVEHFFNKHGFNFDSQKTYAEWVRPYR
ncbi:hypothetical protein [Bacillus pinisoli]|uniref:hypothetical protein n=1 Tax=Bacillus pinisoli TaxID=2901866 RepID=UPI001FF66E5B|nr:hypothetical protein [Bacillus pinisoli]